jgi:predicted metal-binding protein
MNNDDDVILRLCASCQASPDWSALRTRLKAASFAVPVRLLPHDCMNGCARPVSMALQAPARATCFFAGVDPVADAADIVATVDAYIAAPVGWIADAQACGRLRFCLVGRVPAL